MSLLRVTFETHSRQVRKRYALILAIREASKIISRKIRAHSWTTFISVNFVIIRGQSR